MRGLPIFLLGKASIFRLITSQWSICWVQSVFSYVAVAYYLTCSRSCQEHSKRSAWGGDQSVCGFSYWESACYRKKTFRIQTFRNTVTSGHFTPAAKEIMHIILARQVLNWKCILALSAILWWARSSKWSATLWLQNIHHSSTQSWHTDQTAWRPPRNQV